MNLGIYWKGLISTLVVLTTALVKTLDLKEEYVFQPKAYVKYLISLHPFTKGLVKVFRRFISKIRILRLSFIFFKD